MPTYQYACTECGHAFDQVQSFSEDALTVCPQCQGKLRKVFNAVGVVFKGSGFYRTDSRGKPASEGAPAAAAASSSGDSGTAASTSSSGDSSSTSSGSSGSSGSSTSTATKSPQPTAS